MSDAFLNAYSALEARMRMVDIITNNLANANTVGFKRDFGTILQNENGFDVGSQIDMASGDFITTGNEFDVAIDGPGFFAIQTPAGIRYTRSGAFALNAAGELVTKDGMKVLSSSNSPIVVGEGKVAIQDGGTVTVDGNEVATLKIVTFADARKLQKEGFHRLIFSGDASEIRDVDEPRVKGGYLERSNVNAIDEMVHLMSAYREFESVQRTLRTLMTDMNAKLIQELGRIT